MGRRGWKTLLIVAAVTCCTASAFRGYAADPKAVAELLRAGADAAGAKRWQVCIDALSAAATIESNPKTLGDLGLCEEQAGRFVAAHDHLFRALEGAPTQPAKEPWSRYHAALARVKERVALVVVSTSPPNAKVILDGRPLGPADGRAFAVDPGTHTIAARLAGYEDAVETRSMRAKDMPSFHFQLKKKPIVGAPRVAMARSITTSATPSFASLFVPTASPRGFLVGLTYVGAATTLVGAGTWIGLQVDRASLRAQVDSTACGPAATSRPEVCDVLVERHRQRDTAAMFTVGAGITTGVIAISSALAIRLEWSGIRPSIAPTVNQGGGGLTLRGMW